MFGAIYLGMSGLQAYSEGLQKVSNNVSNLNSTGFKTSSVTFTNLQAARDSGGIALADGGTGGGSGVGLAQTSLNLSAGELRQTSNDHDLAIDGSGFLVLLRGDDVRYARTGSFQIDKDGYVVLAGTDWKLGVLDAGGRAQAVT